MAILSICIPTYNRASFIKKLLDDLQSQSIEDVEVVVVNDGSKDKTDELLQQMQKAAPFHLKYFKQENAGRSSALRKAIMAASGKYVMIMDDEDLIIPNGIAMIKADIDQVERIQVTGRPLAGVVYLTANPAGKVIGKAFPTDAMRCNLIKIYADYKVRGDKKEVLQTHLVKSVMYTTQDGERRTPTSLLWSRIARNYDCLFINKPAVIKDYLDGGMSSKLNLIRSKSPVSSRSVYVEIASQYQKTYDSFLYYAKNQVNSYRFLFHSQKWSDVSLGMSVWAGLGLLLFIKDASFNYWKNK